MYYTRTDQLQNVFIAIFITVRIKFRLMIKMKLVSHTYNLQDDSRQWKMLLASRKGNWITPVGVVLPEASELFWQ